MRVWAQFVDFFLDFLRHAQDQHLIVKFRRFIVLGIKVNLKCLLVGGFNPSEKY